MAKLKRIFIYEELYEEVVAWARKEWETNQRRTPRGVPLHKNFPAALEAYILFKRLEGR